MRSSPQGAARVQEETGAPVSPGLSTSHLRPEKAPVQCPQVSSQSLDLPKKVQQEQLHSVPWSGDLAQT